MLRAGKNAAQGVNQNCRRATRQEKDEVWSRISSKRVSYSRKPAAAPSELPQSFGRRGGAQVSEATYAKVAAGNPFGGPGGMEKMVEFAESGGTAILPE